MEADWEVEIGGDAPVIDASWDGLIDLRREPERAVHLPESEQLPGLADALVQLNSMTSPVWTSKCDVWRPEEFSPDEMDAPDEEATWAIACYLDVLPRSERQWPSPPQAVAECRAACAHLRGVPLRCCRADLVVRTAYIVPNRKDVGVTAYFSACGSTQEDALATLGMALGVFVEFVVAR